MFSAPLLREAEGVPFFPASFGRVLLAFLQFVFLALLLLVRCFLGVRLCRARPPDALLLRVVELFRGSFKLT